jgi:hypothetical protein
MAAEHHDETTGPDESPNPHGKNTEVPDPDEAQNAPIPFGHEEDGDNED